MSQSDLYVKCSCGERVPVTPGKAGTIVPCNTCGCEILVPALLELRRMTAASPVEVEKKLPTLAFLGGLTLAVVLLAGTVAVVVWTAMRRDLHRPLHPGAAIEEDRVTGEKRLNADSMKTMIEELLNLPGGIDWQSLPDGFEQFIESSYRPVDVDLNRSVVVEDPEAAFGEFCTTCHVLPQPDVEPKNLWPGKIRQMYRYAQGPRPVPPEKIPPFAAAVSYWTSRAPDFLAIEHDAISSPPSPLVFTRSSVVLHEIPAPATISCVHFADLGGTALPQLLISDMSRGVVVLWTPSRLADPARVVAHIPNPCRTQVVDLDGDGLRDILVADLGDFWPVDTDKGSVVWLRNRGDEKFEKIVLFKGLGRVNEVRAGDFDSDGDLDLIVAVFGNLQTGMILYLENSTEDYTSPNFEGIPLDDRSGTSDVPIVDLNQDGNLDFIALQSQEKEHILAFVNRGWGSFRMETVYQAPHPRWGSTGIRLVDLDGDGDTDVLYNHGDAFQFPPVARPYHGVSWLENRGTFPFAYHRLTFLPGAQTSIPADLDGDGDLDVVSSVFVPALDPNSANSEFMDTVVWLRQTSPGSFERYSLESHTPYHACGDVGDLDGDGDLDIVMGNFMMFPFKNIPWEATLTVFENQTVLGATDN